MDRFAALFGRGGEKDETEEPEEVVAQAVEKEKDSGNGLFGGIWGKAQVTAQTLLSPPLIDEAKVQAQADADSPVTLEKLPVPGTEVPSSLPEQGSDIFSKYIGNFSAPNMFSSEIQPDTQPPATTESNAPESSSWIPRIFQASDDDSPQFYEFLEDLKFHADEDFGTLANATGEAVEATGGLMRTAIQVTTDSVQKTADEVQNMIKRNSRNSVMALDETAPLTLIEEPDLVPGIQRASSEPEPISQSALEPQVARRSLSLQQLSDIKMPESERVSRSFGVETAVHAVEETLLRDSVISLEPAIAAQSSPIRSVQSQSPKRRQVELQDVLLPRKTRRLSSQPEPQALVNLSASFSELDRFRGIPEFPVTLTSTLPHEENVMAALIREAESATAPESSNRTVSETIEVLGNVVQDHPAEAEEVARASAIMILQAAAAKEEDEVISESSEESIEQPAEPLPAFEPKVAVNVPDDENHAAPPEPVIQSDLPPEPLPTVPETSSGFSWNPFSMPTDTPVADQLKDLDVPNKVPALTSGETDASSLSVKPLVQEAKPSTPVISWITNVFSTSEAVETVTTAAQQEQVLSIQQDIAKQEERPAEQPIMESAVQSDVLVSKQGETEEGPMTEPSSPFGFVTGLFKSTASSAPTPKPATTPTTQPNLAVSTPQRPATPATPLQRKSISASGLRKEQAIVERLTQPSPSPVLQPTPDLSPLRQMPSLREQKFLDHLSPARTSALYRSEITATFTATAIPKPKLEPTSVTAHMQAAELLTPRSSPRTHSLRLEGSDVTRVPPKETELRHSAIAKHLEISRRAITTPTASQSQASFARGSYQLPMTASHAPPMLQGTKTLFKSSWGPVVAPSLPSVVLEDWKFEVAKPQEDHSGHCDCPIHRFNKRLAKK